MGTRGKPDPPGSITVADLVQTPHLQLEVLAGDNGLKRRVAWTHVSELPDPAPWLDGGELLMTNGLGLPTTGAAQAKLVTRLVDRRAAGLGIGVRGPKLRRRMLEEADHLGFPILSIPVDVPFLAIARMVADANQNTAQRRLLRHVRIFDTLRPQGQPRTPDEIFSELEEIAGYDLYLVSRNGTPLMSGFRRPPDKVLTALDAADFDPNTGNPGVPGGYAVPVPLDRRQGTCLVALEREGQEPAGLGAVRHIATIAALELSELYHERETRRRQNAETLAKLFAGELDTPSAEAALSDLGFDANQALVVAVMRESTGELRDDEIDHRLWDLSVPHLLLRDGDLFAVLPGDCDALPLVAKALDVYIGVSRVHEGVGRLAVARKEAVWALECAAAEGNKGTSIVNFSASDSSMHWLPTDIAVLEGLVEDVLQPLIRYDSKNKSSMLESLRVFFEHDRRLQNAASALHVHKHTLSYRLHRIEEITGRDLNHMPDLVQLWLALQAYEIVSDRGASLKAPA
jgi:purine catabolism regulator